MTERVELSRYNIARISRYVTKYFNYLENQKLLRFLKSPPPRIKVTVLYGGLWQVQRQDVI